MTDCSQPTLKDDSGDDNGFQDGFVANLMESLARTAEKRKGMVEKPIGSNMLRIRSHRFEIFAGEDGCAYYHCQFCNSNVACGLWEDYEGHGDEEVYYSCPHCKSHQCNGEPDCDRFVRRGRRMCGLCQTANCPGVLIEPSRHSAPNLIRE
jgi:hypothetical protein